MEKALKVELNKEYPRKWEKINKFTYRLRVPGGWIVRVIYLEADGVSMTFLPMENPDDWVLEF